MAIEIVDLPIEHGDVPYFFVNIFPTVMVMSHLQAQEIFGPRWSAATVARSFRALWAMQDPGRSPWGDGQVLVEPGGQGSTWGDGQGKVLIGC